MELTSYRTQVMSHTAHRLMTRFNPLPPPSHSAQSAILPLPRPPYSWG